MVTVHVKGQTPKQIVRSLQMLSTAGFEPTAMTLGDLTFVVMNGDDLDRFRAVGVPGQLVIEGENVNAKS